MKTSKFVLTGCALAVLGFAPFGLAKETEAQAKAREALNQKMNEMNESSKAVTPEASPVEPAPAPKPATPPTAPKPAVQPPPAVAPAVVVPVAAAASEPVFEEPVATTVPDDEAAAKAREALRQKLDELESKPVVVEKPAVPPAMEKPAEKPVIVVKPQTQPEPAKPVVVVAPAKPEPVAEPVQNDQKFSEVPPPSDTGKARLEVATKPAVKPELVIIAEPTPAATTVEAPPPAFSASKEARLADLLAKYRADEISAAEYHEQRAKIVAEP